jgi:hypothetical protein
MRQTPLLQLMEIKLGRDLRGYVEEAQAAGRSWRGMAADLTEITGVAVTHETLRAWFSDTGEHTNGSAVAS